MILAITEFYHDYRPTIKYVDSDKLDAQNVVDKALMDACRKNRSKTNINATDWDMPNSKFKGTEPHITQTAIVEKPKKFDKAIILNISFDT